MSFYLVCQTISGDSFTLTEGISFRYVKERYTPYTYLEGSWQLNSQSFSEILSLMLLTDSKILHYGYPCGVEAVTEGGRTVLKVKSKGYTDALVHNQPVSGLINNVNLQSLANSYIVCPNISYQQDTPTVSYVNYYDGTSIWDAIVCYSQRATGIHPYIRGANEVCVYKPSSPTVRYTSHAYLLSKGNGNDYSRLISSISSPDASGTQSAYTSSDIDAINRNIIRHKDIPFDMEWVMDPGVGLTNRLAYAKRGFKFDSFLMQDYLGEDIMDSFAIPEINYLSEISKLTVSCSEDKPVTTEILCYHDAYTV